MIAESKDLILSKKTTIPYNEKGADNQNCIVIGSVGTGKSRNFVDPNLLSKGCSFVVTDVKGVLYNKFAGYFENEQSVSRKTLPSYKVKKIDFSTLENCSYYNPFCYIKTEEDALCFANTLVENTLTGDKKTSSDSYWTDSARSLLTSIILYVKEVLVEEEQNINSLSRIFNLAIEYDEGKDKYRGESTGQPILYSLFKDLEEQNPDSTAVRFFKMAFVDCAKTWNCIYGCAAQSLVIFQNKKVAALLSKDTIGLDTIGDEKTILFIIMDETDPTKNVLAGILYTQLFQNLIKKADTVYHGKLPVHTRFIMDDFANCGKIPNIENYISTARSRNISISMILQSESQLQNLYGSMADNIITNCTYMYLGGNSVITQKNIAERLGIPFYSVQNSEDTVYLFFPVGKTRVDKLYDFTKHPNYAVWQQELRSQGKLPVEEKSFTDTVWSDTTDSRFQLQELLPDKNHSKLQKLLDIIKKTVNYYNDDEYADEISASFSEECQAQKRFDNSDAERRLYRILQENTNYNVELHPHLNEIISLENMFKHHAPQVYFQLRTMHVDFVLREKISAKPILAIEVDGYHHAEENDVIIKDQMKDILFRGTDIPLVRIKPDDIRRCKDEKADIDALLHKLFYPCEFAAEEDFSFEASDSNIEHFSALYNKENKNIRALLDRFCIISENELPRIISSETVKDIFGEWYNTLSDADLLVLHTFLLSAKNGETAIQDIKDYITTHYAIKPVSGEE